MAKTDRVEDREKIISFLTDLIAAKTENPPGDEHLGAAVVEKEFKRLNIRYDKFKKFQAEQISSDTSVQADLIFLLQLTWMLFRLEMVGAQTHLRQP